MSSVSPPAKLTESDYEAIAAAVMETEKGRWFLAEYARRNRAADTAAVLEAVGRIEDQLRGERSVDVDRIKLEVGEMKDAIARTKREIAQIKTGGADQSRFDAASSRLDAIVAQTETATSTILGSAEKIQEISWTLREHGVPEAECGALEALVTDIYAACSFQDLTGQHIQKVVGVMRFLESRVDAMMAIWGFAPAEDRPLEREEPEETRPDAYLLQGPQTLGEGIEQSVVDSLMDGDLTFLDAGDPAASPSTWNLGTRRFVGPEDFAADVSPPDDPGPIDAANAPLAFDLDTTEPAPSRAPLDLIARMTRGERLAFFS